MKKLFRVTNVGNQQFKKATFSTDNYWYLQAIEQALSYMGITGVTFTYTESASSTTKCKITVPGYGDKTIVGPSQVDGTTDYLFYVNTETMELFACCSDTYVGVINPGYYGVNGLLGAIFNAAYGIGKGGYLGWKFKDGEIIGTSQQVYNQGADMAGYGSTPWWSVGVILPNRTECLSTPIVPTKINYQRAPIFRNFGESTMEWRGEYFEGIYLCSKYFIGSVKTADNKKFMYNGYMFDVDNAMDIGTIETTI